MNLSQLSIHEYQGTELAAKIREYNAAVLHLNARKRDLDAFTPIPERKVFFDTHDDLRERTLKPSCIGEDTFKTAAEVMALLDARKTERVQIILDSISLVKSLDGIRGECLAAWDRHYAKLKADYLAAVKAAQDEAAGFKGLSDSARRQHVSETTEAAYKATQVSIPEGADYFVWAPVNVMKMRAQLLRELQAFIGREAGVPVPTGFESENY